MVLAACTAVTSLQQQTVAATAAVDLGAATGFTALAGSGITIAGTLDTNNIIGNIGTYPTAITGIANATLNGVNHAEDGITQAAKDALASAYAYAAARPYDIQYTGGFDLVGKNLTSGVYNSASSLFLSGTLTLDAQGNPDAVWIFQAGSTLITASGSNVNLINGAQASNIFWQVGSSATLGTGINFSGSILALTSITVDTGTTVDGRMLAQNGAVTLDSNRVLVPAFFGVAAIAGNLTVPGTMSPGDGPGVLTVTGTTTFGSPSVFEWNLDTTKNEPLTNHGIAYDGLNTAALTGSGAIFRIVFPESQNYASEFWNQSRTWTDIFKSADGSTIVENWAAVFGGGFQYSCNGQTAAPSSQGSFTISGNSLTWSAVPEPGGAVIGLLIAAGLCRRHRHSSGKRAA